MLPSTILFNVEEGSRFEDWYLYFVPTSLLDQLKLLYMHTSFGTGIC